jgi:hypothetical protein
MVYSTQNYSIFGIFTSSGVLGSRNTTFRKLDLFPSLGEEEGGEDAYSVGFTGPPVIEISSVILRGPTECLLPIFT